MSTPNPAEVIAEALAKHQHGASVPASLRAECDKHLACTCGEWVSSQCKTMTARDEHRLHQASVVAALPNIAIVPTTSVEYAPCWQNEHGVHPLNSTTTWRKGAEDDIERLRADDPEIFLGVHYRTPWLAARSAGGQS